MIKIAKMKENVILLVVDIPQVDIPKIKNMAAETSAEIVDRLNDNGFIAYFSDNDDGQKFINKLEANSVVDYF